jgi:hypothetical protein
MTHFAFIGIYKLTCISHYPANKLLFYFISLYKHLSLHQLKQPPQHQAI